MDYVNKDEINKGDYITSKRNGKTITGIAMSRGQNNPIWVDKKLKHHLDGYTRLATPEEIKEYNNG